MRCYNLIKILDEPKLRELPPRQWKPINWVRLIDPQHITHRYMSPTGRMDATAEPRFTGLSTGRCEDKDNGG